MRRGATMTVLGLAVMLLGCGSSSKSGQISKAEFIRRADSICSSGAKRVPGLTFDPATATRKQLPQIARYLPHVIHELQSEHDAIGALPTPAGGRALLTQALAYLQRYVGLLTSEKKAAAAGNLARFQALYAKEFQPTSPGLLANQRARAFGLKVCGRG